ncbi:RagB/SusD family nutrient uptake outer membrane protein [Carboxylicivirga linearis]|uniref:RagB/SusD family nutrient uptake outer membrane protein n=1 Tax=Carboxylicivirga linearis TaxID=1628157 RepID=A0ABS5K0H0_9BACT|nr:RagB/SusD family nutrient uptake outer membrane protein [Carboxylicivirga linearis]MBS2100667.1 RagB/SusD family nutrient uptake outer membrane protein [Carboxylicivirga linearis]
MKMKNINIYIVALISILALSCSDYLETEPQGFITAGSPTIDAAEGLVTAAYAGIGNDDMIGPIASMWVYGSVRSDDAYKGGGGVADMEPFNFYEQYNLTQPFQNWLAGLPFTWENYYRAISRANSALKTLNELTDEEYALRKTRMAEARFLRGHSHFMLKVLFKYIPYITEDLSKEEILATKNRAYTNDELWSKIAEDFEFAMNNLPGKQPEVGRANKYAAEAYLAKLRLYQAYEQDDNNQVININKERLQEVVDLCEDVITKGGYSLQPDFGENFLDGYDNGPESVFAIQFSISDGTTVGRLNFENGLNYPHGAPQYGCCGFHQPSQNLVNAFATSTTGLPKFDTFNDVELSAADITPDGVTVDPRIDHSVGLDGHPYKYRNEENYIFSNSWVRDPGVYGYFQSMKEQQAADCSCYKKEGPFMGVSKNIDVIRYADVLLMQAEAYIELGQPEMARPLINQVRKRAAESTGRTRFADGSAPSNYLISEYDGTNLAWNQENARIALRWERRLEFALESPRFFDLVRWGIAATTLNDYLEKEKTRHDFLNNAKFTAGRDEYFPIPQREIDFTVDSYTQNVGY